MGLFKERKNKLLLLSMISAVAVISTAFVGLPIYAQSDGSNMTTFEEQAQAAGANVNDTSNSTSTAANSTTSSNANGSTSTAAADLSVLNGLVICHLSTMEVSGQTQTAATNDTSGKTPTVSVKVMSAADIAQNTSNETTTSSANGTSIASADCRSSGNSSNATSTSSSNATAGGNATGTSTASNNATSTSNMTSNSNNTMSSTTSNQTSISSGPTSNKQILVIEGKDFVPGQVVLIFSKDALIGIDDVDSGGNIEAKVPMPHSTGTSTASNATSSTELRFLESGTQRTGAFEFNGQTLTSAASGGQIKSEGSEGGATAPAATPSNSTSTNSTSMNSTGTSSMNSTGTSNSSAPQY